MNSHFPLVKICGVIDPEDALIAGNLGANYVGMILSENSKRYVNPVIGKEIAQASREGGAEPIAVFIEEDSESIYRIAQEMGVGTVQLHGEKVRENIQKLSSQLSCIFVAEINADGSMNEKNRLELLTNHSFAKWVLCDYLGGGGTGYRFDWERFTYPLPTPWFLAGGINPGNVRDAILKLHPAGLDVSSGVELRGSLRKDPGLIAHLIENVRQAEYYK